MALGHRLAVFDLYGTLLDVSGLAAKLSGILGRDATALLAAWRTAQLERTWELDRRVEFEPFDRVTAWSLAKVAGELDEALRARLSEQWFTLPAYPDAVAALQRLASRGVRTSILSNGTLPMSAGSTSCWPRPRASGYACGAPRRPRRAATGGC